MTLESEVLLRISPSAERRREIQDIVRSLLARTEEEAGKDGRDLSVVLVGSVAKDTFLREPDIDIFVQFPEEVDRDDMEAVGLSVGKRVLGGGEERYAEHPYVHGSWEGLEVDIVPCYRLNDASRLRSAVDRTPFHTQYVRSHLMEEQKGEVRLLKQFAKGIGVYGAEAKVQGFSGYLLELLVLKYGTFLDVLKASAGWRKGTELCLEGRGSKRFEEPLVFYDPVDLNRNVASALSSNCLATFIHASHVYLQGPSELFFFPRPREPLDLGTVRQSLKQRGSGLLLVRMERPGLIDDNLYPQVRRTLDGLCALLSAHDFRLVDRAFHVSDDLRFLVELEAVVLPCGRHHSGPPAWIENASSFLERWSREGLGQPFLENGHWAVVAPREHPAADDLVRSKLNTAALGSDIRKQLSMTTVMGDEVLTEENRPVLSALFDKRMNWEV